MADILYFGYGANADCEMIKAITGERHVYGLPAELIGYVLGIQRLDQIPIIAKVHDRSSPHEIISRHWEADFRSYVIVPGQPTDKVAGMIWSLTPLARALVRAWELVADGWYQEITGQVSLESGELRPVITEMLGPGQSYCKTVDGRNYPIYLVSAEKMRRLAAKFRLNYLASTRVQPYPK